MTGAVIIVRQNKLMRQFHDAGATGPEAGKSLAELGVRDSWIFRRMVKRGVFVRTGGGAYYMDTARGEAFLHARCIRAWTIVIVLSVLFLILVAYLWW